MKTATTEEELYEPEECAWCGKIIPETVKDIAHMHPACFKEARGEYNRTHRIDRELEQARAERVINK